MEAWHDNRGVPRSVPPALCTAHYALLLRGPRLGQRECPDGPRARHPVGHPELLPHGPAGALHRPQAEGGFAQDELLLSPHVLLHHVADDAARRVPQKVLEPLPGIVRVLLHGLLDRLEPLQARRRCDGAVNVPTAAEQDSSSPCSTRGLGEVRAQRVRSPMCTAKQLCLLRAHGALTCQAPGSAAAWAGRPSGRAC